MPAPADYSFAGLPNHALLATLSATTVASGSAVANALNASMFTLLRSSAASTDWILTADLLSSKTVGLAGLFGTNLGDSATVEWEHDDNSGFTSPTSLGVDTPFGSLLDSKGVAYTPPWGRHAIHVLTTPTADRYWRATVNDTGNPDSEYQIAYLILAELRTPATGPLSFIPQVVWSGPRHVDLAWMRHRVDFGALDESERTMFLNLAASFGRTGVFAAIPRPDTSAAFVAEAILCSLANPVAGSTVGPPTTLTAAAKPASTIVTLDEVYY